MSELKTTKTTASVSDFLAGIADETKRLDSQTLCRLMQELSGDPPVMWGSSIVGFGTHHYKYASGREGDWMKVAFSPRKQNLTLYLMGGVEPHQQLLNRLGPHSTGVGCLYIKRLADVDMDVLRQLIKGSLDWVKRNP